MGSSDEASTAWIYFVRSVIHDMRQHTISRCIFFLDCFFPEIQAVLCQRGIKKDKDVEELYLSNRNLAEVKDLRRFRYLKKLWLNGNKLRRINFLSSNFRLCELHLHSNHLNDISGSLQHLTCLVVLTLHNNYLTDLERVVKEFNRMSALTVLNLFDNPVAHEPEYRLFVINSVPSLTVLDRSKITKSERDMAQRMCQQDGVNIKDKVAFGRKSLGPPNLFFPTSTKRGATRPEAAANNYLKNKKERSDLSKQILSLVLMKGDLHYFSLAMRTELSTI